MFFTPDLNMTCALSSMPARLRRSHTMKVIFSGAPAHLSAVAGSVMTAWPPLDTYSCMAFQVASAACGLG